MTRRQTRCVARAVCLLAATLSLVPRQAAAQSRSTLRPLAAGRVSVTPRAAAAALPTPPVLRRSAPEAGPPPVDIVTRPQVVRAAPKAFQVVSVAVPEELVAAGQIDYVVMPLGGTPVLGRRSGVIAAGGATRAISLTLGVPGNARAGMLRAASVIFFAAAAPTVEVPVVLDVSASRRVELTLEESLLAGRSGERITLRYRLINLGNAMDTITVRAGLPQGWRAEGGDGVTALAPGAVVQRTLSILLPRDMGGGSLPVRLTAYSHARALASVELLVELMGGSAMREVAGGGAVLRVGASAARGPWEGTPLGAIYQLNGHVTESIQVSALAVTAPTPGSASQMALARTGLAQVPASLAAWTSTWRAAAGPVGGTLTDLTGTSVGGQGLSFQITKPRWGANLIGTRPVSGPVRYGTTSLAGQVSARLGEARVIGSASSLRETLGPIGAPRTLDAVSAGLEMGSLLDRRVATELAYRRFDGGSGLGASASASVRGARGMFDVRAAHAAGGSQAFARGTNELSLQASRQLSRVVGVNASAWRLGDEAAASRSVQSSGWSLGATAQMASALSVNVGARAFDYTTRSLSGAFGSGDQSVYGAVQSKVGPFSASVDGTYGIRTRSVTVGDGSAAPIVDRAPASRYGSSMSASSRAGVLSVTGAVSQMVVTLGYPPRQYEMGASLEQVPLLTTRAVRLIAGAAATRVTSFVTPGAWITTTRGTLGAELPLGVAVSLDAERNPLYFVNTLTPAQARQWTYVARIERSMALRGLGGRRHASGVIFTDTDGDGARSASEQGLAGIVVRRGGASVVTDRNGRYRFDGASADVPTVDVRSLPLGMIAKVTRAGATGGDLAITALAAVDAILRVDAEDSLRVTVSDLAAAIVSATDTSGRVWVARVLSPGVVRFDALPPGRYRTAVDFSQAREPLAVKGTAPSFTVREGDAPSVQIVVHPRPLRFPSARPAGPSSVGAQAGEPQAPAPKIQERQQ